MGKKGHISHLYLTNSHKTYTSIMSVWQFWGFSDMMWFVFSMYIAVYFGCCICSSDTLSSKVNRIKVCRKYICLFYRFEKKPPCPRLRRSSSNQLHVHRPRRSPIGWGKITSPYVTSLVNEACRVPIKEKKRRVDYSIHQSSIFYIDVLCSPP